MIKKFALIGLIASILGCGYDPVFESDQEPASATALTVDEQQKPVQMSDAAFRLAAQNGQSEKVRQAIEAGVEIDSADRTDGMTALHLAAHDGRKHIVSLLIDNKATIDIRDNQGHTPLLMAAYNGHTEVIKILHQSGAEIDARDSQGNTPLIHASSGPYQDAVEYLIESGADINAIDSGEGFTPLMTAAALGEVQVVQVLLKHNADKSIKDGDGDTAMSHAMNSKNAEIVALLK